MLYLSFEDIEPTGEFIENVRSISPLSHYLYTLFRENRTGSCVSRDLSDMWTASERFPGKLYREGRIRDRGFRTIRRKESAGLGWESRETVILLSALIVSLDVMMR